MVSIEVEAPPVVENVTKKWTDGKKTYTAIAAAILVSLGGMFGLTFTETLPIQLAQYGDLTEDFVYIVLAVLAWWGRAKAVTPGFIGKKKLTK